MTHWSVADIPDQHGRTAVVTGANSGLGLEICRALAAKGATVVLACRSAPRANAAADAIRASVPEASLDVRSLDLADLGSVTAFADGFAADYDRLDVLVNNAGLMAIDKQQTVDGFEMQFGVNHLGHFALTGQLLPMLLRTPGSRVANMASMGHRLGRLQIGDLMFENGYKRWPAYFQSKLANLLFTAELQRRLAAAGAGTIAVTAHPGGSNTDLGTEGTGLTNKSFAVIMPFVTQSAATGALPMLRAATAPDVEGGQFYGPRFVTAGWVVQERPSRRARNDADARALWDASVILTGVDPAAALV